MSVDGPEPTQAALKPLSAAPRRLPCHDASNCTLHNVAVAAVVKLDIDNPQNSEGNTGGSKRLHGASLTRGRVITGSSSAAVKSLLNARPTSGCQAQLVRT